MPNFSEGNFKLPDDPITTKASTNGIGNLGDLISKLIPYIYIFAGFAMIIVIITGGYDILTSQGTPEKTKAGFDKIAKGITGFILVVASYFVVMLVEGIFKIKIF